ncbi:MAG: sodium:solute symporter [Calditrichaeota bacterium]|nr:sodium:solute symporter [Calditrichota bacterium]
MPSWAAAVSLLATALSAATFIGGPQQAYRGDLTYLSANLGAIVAVFIVALYFIPVYYRENAVTVYQILEKRFGPAARQAAGAAYLIGRLFASGARLYIAALPASLIVYGDIELPHLFAAIGLMTVVGVIYTLVGGVRSVIWSDVIQTAIFVGAAIAAIVLLLDRIPAPLSEIIGALRSPGEGAASKLTLLKTGFEGIGPANTYTLLTALIGFSLLNLAAYGTDQDMAQRMLTCKSATAGSRSAIGGILIGLPVTALFMVAGLLLWIFYQRPELMGASAPTYQPEGSREVFLTFILREMPAGMTGLMMAGLFAAALSTLNSGINAMASTFINDFYRKWRPDREERHYLQTGIAAVAGFGLLLGLFAVGSAVWQASRPGTTLIDFALTVMVFAYSGLAAVYLTAIFTRRGNSRSVVAALIVGFGSVVTMQAVWSPVLAFPWQLTIATSVALAVALAGRPAQRSG